MTPSHEPEPQLTPIHPDLAVAVPSEPRRGGPGRLLAWFTVITLALFGLGALSFQERRTDRRRLADQTERLSVPYVAVVHAVPSDSTSELVLPGNIQSFIESPIYARTNGYLKKWYHDIGSHVQQGELLAEIDTPEVDASLAQARADLSTAQANAKLASLTAARYQDLLKSDSVSRQEVDNFEGDLAAKGAMEQSADANVKRLEELESFKRVFAPFSGVITKRNVDIGSLINAGNGGTSTKELFDLAQTDPLRVFISVPQTYAPSMHAGLPACLELAEFPGRRFCGRVARTAEAVDPSDRTLMTEVDVSNSSGTLLPGEYAQVHFDASLSGRRLVLANNALLFRPEGTLAAVVGQDGRIHLKKLTVGRDFGTTVEVVDGLTVDDAVVINPPDSLEEGEHVGVTPDADPKNESH